MGTGTSLGRVRGLGAAHAGPHHWWMQRVTAAGNLLLITWFIVSLARLPVLDHQALVLWLKSPLVAVPMVLLVISVFYHFRLGLQVFIEDYTHESVKIFWTLVFNAYALAAGALCIFSILKIAFGGVQA
ncbi:succinate dehydrogenase, hydrophobic membrane anchor protein [Sphingomonas morindae]|uniref:Succinate dehydrogenase hydrophobic membrane anchor subunit n=1 Tax=Sphingomonas morindae TaxID=1541170 RepID=A0ABY4X9K1_9SPHN|nr:succinate dehydrogenase, hydrophobic membrane anchor protein [Sphingomonas morindae]USI73612.1 succinate dehydrogenase, hydrophobic membrane anchor protein [Sphingomonas morindae]